jgi:hypothetical protein
MAAVGLDGSSALLGARRPHRPEPLAAVGLHGAAAVWDGVESLAHRRDAAVLGPSVARPGAFRAVARRPAGESGGGAADEAQVGGLAAARGDVAPQALAVAGRPLMLVTLDAECSLEAGSSLCDVDTKTGPCYISLDISATSARYL